MSLKSTLNQIIKDRNGGIVTVNEIEAFCHKAHYKLSNAERRLRRSESPDIERVMKNGAIVGYCWNSSMVERPFEERQVVGSIPTSSTKIPDWFFSTKPKVIQQKLL